MPILRRHALVPTVLLSLVAVCAFLARVVWVDWTFAFLPRNLVLALIPVGLAAAALGVARTPIRWVAVPLLVGWLLFLPNSVYLVTDLIHLRERPGIPLVYDSAMCGLFAAAGVLAGVSSLSMAIDCIEALAGRWVAWAALLPVFFLNGLGIWMGRYQRWNSWDLASDPFGLVQSVWTPLVHPSIHLWGIALTYAAVLAVAWFSWVSVRPPARLPVTGGAYPAWPLRRDRGGR